MLPLEESRWWYDTTYPQYTEGSAILSDWTLRDSGSGLNRQITPDRRSPRRQSPRRSSGSIRQSPRRPESPRRQSPRRSNGSIRQSPRRPESPSKLIDSDYSENTPEFIKDIVEQRTFDELVDGTNSVSKDVWVTGNRLNQHNNVRRARESIQFLTEKKDVSEREIIRNELEDSVFMRDISRQSSEPIERVCRNHEIPEYDGDIIADMKTLELNPVNMKGRETIRSSSWISRPDRLRTPTLTRTIPGYYSNNIGYREEWQIQPSSNKFIRIRRKELEIQDVDNLESMFDKKYDGKPIEYNVSPERSVKDNVLYYDSEDGDVNIVYSEIGNTIGFPSD